MTENSMLNFIKKPVNDVVLDETQKQWLKSMDFSYDESLLDCDPIEQTITFQTEDGPIKRQVVETITRVMGYHRPITSFNIGKKSEHKERLYYKECKTGYEERVGF